MNYKAIFLILSLSIINGCCIVQSKTEPRVIDDETLCTHIANEVYLYSLLSVNSYEAEENTPFVLPENIREVRHEGSKLSNPSRKYIHSKVYDNGSFQAKVFEIKSIENMGGQPLKVVIAYRGTQNLIGSDMLKGTIKRTHRKLAIQLYEEIKKHYDGSGAEIILTGHSLGGALALEVAYTYNDEKIDTYVFNPSYRISSDKKLKEIDGSARIIVVVEKHDPLGLFRKYSTAPKGIKVYKFNFVKSLLGNHSKLNIALGLLKKAKGEGEEDAIKIFDMNRNLCDSN